MKHQTNLQRVVRVAGILVLFSPAILLSQAANPCDVTGDGSVTGADVNAVVSGAIGQATCTANIVGAAICNAEAVQRVVNASQGGTCIAGNSHSATLNWTASGTATVAGYNVYRATSSSGQFVKITTSPVTGTSYTDTTVQSGQGYSYRVTSVDDLGNESSFSGIATASVPYP
jgi:hypothetical protein